MAETTLGAVSVAEATAAWYRLDLRYRHNPGNARIAGARAASEWTMRRSPVSPITRRRVDPDGDALQWEGHHADEVIMGLRPGDPQFADGVMSWMFWWIGLEPLPAWLR
jgi:hypothetical protein